VTELERETDRAGALVAGLPPRKAWSLLQRRGFEVETIESVLGDLDGSGVEGLG
jgi:SOS response regulatory protein OraA/RecX